MKGLAPNSVFSSSQIYKVQMTNCQPNYTKACLHNSAFKKPKSCVSAGFILFLCILLRRIFCLRVFIHGNQENGDFVRLY